MLNKARTARAFTLIELLAVIAIIALLVSLLVPYVSRAKSLAMRSQCQASLKGIGAGVQIFANQFGGRGPGYSLWHSRQLPPSDPNDTWNEWSMGWTGMLNRYAFGGETRVVTLGYAPGSKSVYACSSGEYWGGSWFHTDWCRFYVMNEYVCSAWAWGSNGPGDPDGKLVIPTPFPTHSAGEYFTLGAVLANFPQPSYQFLVTEAETGWEYIRAQNNDPTTGYKVPLAASYDFYANNYPSSQTAYACPPWDSMFDNPYHPGQGDYGCRGYAFRHTRPNAFSQYQTSCTANFLFIDGHVDALYPNDRIDAADRYGYR